MSDVNEHSKWKKPIPHYVGLIRGKINCEWCGKRIRIRIIFNKDEI